MQLNKRLGQVAAAHVIKLPESGEAGQERAGNVSKREYKEVVKDKEEYSAGHSAGHNHSDNKNEVHRAETRDSVDLHGWHRLEQLKRLIILWWMHNDTQRQCRS